MGGWNISNLTGRKEGDGSNYIRITMLDTHAEYNYIYYHLSYTYGMFLVQLCTSNTKLDIYVGANNIHCEL